MTFSNGNNSNSEWALSVTVDVKGSFAYVGYHDGSVSCFDYSSGNIVKQLSLHSSAVKSLCLSKDGEYLVTGSEDRTAKVKSYCSYISIINNIV